MSDFEALKKEILLNLTTAPLSEKVLARRLNVNDRLIRQAVVSLLEDKYPILSNTKGLWLETDPVKILEHAEKNRELGLTYLRKYKLLKNASVEVKFGQLNLI